jgi:polar amino acid transport system substrate-binding protein
VHRAWRRLAVVVGTIVLVLPACSGSDHAERGSASGARTGCASDGTGLRRAGHLAVATASPAVQPWFEDDDPSNGKGFESEVAYAVAGEMGIGPQGVDWSRVPEAEALSRGDHRFDVYLGQVAVTSGRRRVVDLSVPYYRLDQALVAPTSSAAASATTTTAIAGLKLGVAAGSDSAVYVRDVLGATAPPVAFLDDADAATGLAQGRFDALVVPLDEAVRMANGAVPGTAVVGRFPDRPTSFGFVLPKGSGLTACVDQAVRRLADAGTFDVLEQSYLTEFLDVRPIGS